jgi:MOSC domain-containing protein YiiM
MASIGPYRFSPTDAIKTCQKLGVLWRLRTEGRPGADERCEPVARWLAMALGERLGIGYDDGDPVAAMTRLGALAASTPPVSTGVLEIIWEGLAAQAEALRGGGLLPPLTEGRIEQLSTSPGGVPKLAVAEADIDWGGLTGDRQSHRQHHGRPWQAVCIWSAEVIEAFAADGHPLHAGAAGENVTVRGLPWEEVRPPARLRLGAALVEVSAYATPCRYNAQWFSDRDPSRIHHDRGPVSRVYATVLEPGHVAAGDPAILEP